MKITDNPEAKYEIWAGNPKVFPLPKASGMPSFKSVKFNSYQEMNAWKRARLDQIARNSGVRWTK